MKTEVLIFLLIAAIGYTFDGAMSIVGLTQGTNSWGPIIYAFIMLIWAVILYTIIVRAK